MTLVILNWLYVGITTFICGYAILSLFTRLTGYQIKQVTTPFFAGLIVVTVYAQIFSLFAGVSLLANGLLVVFCLLILILQHRDICSFVKDKLHVIKRSQIVLTILLILLFSYGTSRGYIHFDTGLYHAQSIRWIEEYGVVPGLANLQARFGYNSAAFSLTALYSMAFMAKQSLHTTAGYFALLSSFLTLGIAHIWKDKTVKLSDFARIGLIFYLSIIFSQMVSPASDYYAQLLIFDSVILWLDLLEGQQEEKGYAPYALILFLLVYAVTIKFSVATMLLLVLLPAVYLIHDKNGKGIAGCILTGTAILAPFLIRNVLICGWLVYPSTIVDLFNVDWKVPKGQVQYDAMEIGVYGRGINDVTKWDTPFSQWIGPWFQGLKGLEKVWIILSVLAFILSLVYLLIRLIRYTQGRHHKGKSDWGFMLIWITITVSALFWFMTAPLIRYGYAYITLLPLLSFGYFYLFLEDKVKIKGKQCFHVGFTVLLIAFLLTRAKGVTADIARTWQQDYYVTQEDYPDGEAFTYEIDGITVYVPTESGQIGYYKFPSSPLVQNIELRGNSLKDGFRQKGESK